MAEPIRILHVFASLNIGGAESRMMDVYRKLDRNKIQFDFITLTQGEQFFESEIRQLGGKIYRLRNPRETGIITHFKDLISVMKSCSYQAVHAHTSYHCGFVSFAAAIAGIKIRVSHARTTGTIQKGIGSHLNIILGKFLISLFSNKKLCISRDAGVFLYGEKALKNTKAIILPNAINLDEYESLDYYDENIELQVKDSYIIGHIGRFSEMKNHNFLISVFEQLAKNSEKYKLILIGDGVLKSKIQVLVNNKNLNNKVIFTGNRRDIPYLLSKIDVLVLPSIYEGLGGVVIEAQAAGVPCVISNALPKEIDLGLNLVSRVALNDSLNKWACEISSKIGKKLYNRKLIRTHFEKANYTVEKEIGFLLKEVYCEKNGGIYDS
jgi:glycosyltransferase EpsF